MTAKNYLIRFFEEKELTSDLYIIEHDGLIHCMDTDGIKDIIINHASEEEQNNIRSVLQIIDFYNGDIHHYLKFLATCYVKQNSDVSISQEELTLLLKELEQEIKNEGQRQIENLMQGKRFCVADVGDSVYMSDTEFKNTFTEEKPLPEGIKQYFSREGYAEHFINAPRVTELIGPVATNSDEVLLYVTLQFLYLKNNPEEIGFP